MKNFWQGDTALKIFSVVCAIALWFYVIAAQNPEIEVKVKNIPIQIDATSEETLYRSHGLCVLKPVGGLKTSLTVKGRRSVIGGVDNKNIKAVVDVSKVEKAGTSDPLTISVHLPESTSLYVMNINPLQVNYPVEEGIERIVPVECEPSKGVDDAHYLSDLSVSPSEIKIWGPKSIISTVEKLLVTPDLSKMNEDFSEDFSYTAVNGEGKNVDLINVSSYVDTVRVSGKVLGVRTVPLEIVTEHIDAPAGYIVSEASVEPKRIQVRGTEKSLADLESILIRVNPKKISGEVGAQELEGEVVFPLGITADEENLSIYVKIVLEEESETNNE